MENMKYLLVRFVADDVSSAVKVSPVLGLKYFIVFYLLQN